MYRLTGLEGIRKKNIDAKEIYDSKDLKELLSNNRAVTAANKNGAINIWKDDKGKIRCESMRYCTLLDKQIYDTVEEAEIWLEKWLEKIK